MNEINTAKSEKTIPMESIVVARGIAALLVVFHHAGSIASQPRFYGYDAFDGHLTRFTGINFFFVVSGFFIGWVNWKNIGLPGKAWDFAVRRMGRIYPSYWLILIPLIILYQVFPNAGFDSQRAPLNVLFSIVLLPYDGAQPVYGVAWTLVHEFLFCVVISLIILWGRRAIVILPIWGLAIVVGNVFFDHLPYPVDFLLAGVNLQFLIGIGTARLFKSRTVPLPIPCFLTGVLIYFGLIFFGAGFHFKPFEEVILYSLAMALIISGLVQIERRHQPKFPKIVSLFGHASFSLYLIHPIVLSAAIHILTRFIPLNLSAEVAVIIIALVAIAAAIAFDRIVESPLNRAVRQRLDRRPVGVVKSSANAS
jgi:exopolysaccharide production protein ExoZ